MPIAQASTWNKELIHKVGTAISDRIQSTVNYGYPSAGLTFWAPVVEMARDPRWGRNHESYGEDPYLTSQISLGYVEGIQGDHPRYLKPLPHQNILLPIMKNGTAIMVLLILMNNFYANIIYTRIRFW